jgi:hypothetical protein
MKNVYYNKKHNIRIQNTQGLIIEKEGPAVSISFDEHSKYIVPIKKYTIFPNSRVTFDLGTNTLHTYADSDVYVRGGASIEAHDKSRITAHEDSIVMAYDNSIVEANEHTYVEARGFSVISAVDNSTIHANDRSRVMVCKGSPTIFAAGFSVVDVIYPTSSDAKIYADGFSIAEINVPVTIHAREFSHILLKTTEECIINRDNHFGIVSPQIFVLDRDMIVYKKLRDNRIAEMKLEKGQVFQCAHYDKCRTDRALVMSIESNNGEDGEQFSYGVSFHNPHVLYEVGKVISAQYAPEIDECSSGIHFFLTKEKAQAF